MTLATHNIEVKTEAEGRFHFISLSGKLNKEDYKAFVPNIDDAIERHKTINVLFDIAGFRGWTLAAFFEDAKFGLNHYRGFKRLAFVGDRRWEKGLAMLCKPFTRAEVRYFDINQMDAAKNWIREMPGF